MPSHFLHQPALWLRRCGAPLLAALGLVVARPAPAQSTQAVSTAAGSNITIQVTNVYNGMPARGYLPLRVSIANTSNNDGRWEVVTQAMSAGGDKERHFGAQATCPVPAHQTQVFEVLAPLPTTVTGGQLPRVSVHISGPGVTNGDVQFSSNLQDPPPSALTRMVPTNPTPTTTRGRVGTTTVISISSDGSNTRTNTTIQADGTTITEAILTRADGSSTTTTTTRNPSGALIGTPRIISSPAPRGSTSAPRGSASAPANTVNTYTGSTIINAGGVGGSGTSTATSSVTRNADGSTTKTTIIPQSSGATRTENVTTFPDGSTSTSFTVKDSSGQVIQNGSTGRALPGAASPAPPPNPPALLRPPSAGQVQGQGSGNTLSSLPKVYNTAPVMPPNASDRQKLTKIIIPRIDIDLPTPLDQVMATLTVLSRKYDPEGKGLNFFILPPTNGAPMPKIKLQELTEVSLAQLVELACRYADYGYSIDDGVVTLIAGGKTPTTPATSAPKITPSPAPATPASSVRGPDASTFQWKTVPMSLTTYNWLVAAGKGASAGSAAIATGNPGVISNDDQALSAPVRRSLSTVAQPLANAVPRGAAGRTVREVFTPPGNFAPAWAGAAIADNTAKPAGSTPPTVPSTIKPASAATASPTTNLLTGAVNIALPAILGSPQSGGIQINNGNITISGSGLVQGSVTLSNGTLTISNGGSLTIGGSTGGLPTSGITVTGSSAPLVKLGSGVLTFGGPVILAAAAPPPPPPAPPPVTVRSGVVVTGGASLTISSGPSTRGRAGYQNITRLAGAPIFIGLSATLSQNLGDKIKNYFNTTCARPIQQTTLDTNPDTTLMSSDWRAYLGFDIIFLTGADWVGASGGVRTALAYWVAAGGELRLVANADGGLNLPVRQGEHYGAGAIELFTEDELNNYNFTLEHTDSKERYLFSLEYKPSMLAPVTEASGEIPAGFERREFIVSQFILQRYIGSNAIIFSSAAATAQPLVESDLTGFFARAGTDFPTGASLKYSLADDKVTITNTKANLDVIGRLLSNYGAPDGVVMGTGPALSVAPPASTVASAGTSPATVAKAPMDLKQYGDEVPHLGNHYMLVATVIICFGLMVGPLNLFWFCKGPRRPHLLWVTPVLAIAASAAIVAFILLAEGIGGRGIYFRITQLVPDGKVAVESEVESSVTGLLTHRDFVLPQPAWILDFKSSKGEQEWERGDFMQSGGHYQGDWFVSRREQTIVARSVVPTRAQLRLSPPVEGKPPVVTSDYNDWMQSLYYMDGDSHYWKLDKISDGKPTSLLPATKEEFDAAWGENLRSAPEMFAAYLRKLTPRPGTFFALGNGSASYLEPDYTGLRWNRFRHIITGPVAQ